MVEPLTLLDSMKFTRWYRKKGVEALRLRELVKFSCNAVIPFPPAMNSTYQTGFEDNPIRLADLHHSNSNYLLLTALPSVNRHFGSRA